MHRLPLAAALAFLASACASVPMASPEADRAAKAFKPPADQANLYLFRDENFGAAVRFSVLLDGAPLGETAAKTFLFAPVAPGTHTLVSKAENDAELTFTAEAGKNVFVWQEVKMGILSARSRLELVDEPSAKARIRTCKLAETIAPKPAPGQGLLPPQS